MKTHQISNRRALKIQTLVDSGCWIVCVFSLKEKYLAQALLNLDSSLGIFYFHRIHHLILGIFELFVPQKK